MDFYMAKDYNESAMYERSSERRAIELRALHNYRRALIMARKYKMEIEYISAREKYVDGSDDNLRYEKIRSRAKREGVNVHEIDKIIPEIPEVPKEKRILVYVR